MRMEEKRLGMERFDVVDETGIPSGEVVERSEAHIEGIRHRTAHIWVTRLRDDGRVQVLLQKRSQNKDSFPGQFDTSSAGHIQAGDKPMESAIRELEEELGIHAGPEDLDYAGTFHIEYNMEFHGKPFRDNEIAFVYVYKGPVDESTLTLQTEEVEEVDWFDLVEVYHECLAHNRKFCVPTEGLRTLIRYFEGSRISGLNV